MIELSIYDFRCKRCLLPTEPALAYEIEISYGRIDECFCRSCWRLVGEPTSPQDFLLATVAA